MKVSKASSTGPYCYDYPKADNTVDAVVLGIDWVQKELMVLLIERLHEPFKGCWAIPGGFANEDETLVAACQRELKEETGVIISWLEQLATFGDPNRDPRGRVISTAHLALVRTSDLAPKAGDDAAKVKWNSVNDLPPLAFDHNTIIETALQRLRMKTRWQPVGINLLPETFTLRDLQDVYEIILGKKLDARNFRSKVLRFGVLTPTGVKQGNHRPAMLWRFDRENYEALLEQGMDFGI